MIEDQVSPKRCGHTKGKLVVDRAEAIDRIKAAVHARDAIRQAGGDIMILARTDARAIHGLDEAIWRANAFTDAGADILFIEAPHSEAEMARMIREAPGIHMANMVEGGATPILSQNALRNLGYGLAIFPLTLFSAAMKAVKDSLASIKAGEHPADAIMDFGDLRREIGFDAYYDNEQRYSRRAQGLNGMSDADKPFRYYLRVRYQECDAQLVVFNARYGDYVDIAGIEFWRAIGLADEVAALSFDVQLVKQTTTWKAPARNNQVLELSVTADASRHHVVHGPDRIPHRRQRRRDLRSRDDLRPRRQQDPDQAAPRRASSRGFAARRAGYRGRSCGLPSSFSELKERHDELVDADDRPGAAGLDLPDLRRTQGARFCRHRPVHAEQGTAVRRDTADGDDRAGTDRRRDDHLRLSSPPRRRSASPCSASYPA